MNHFPLLSPCSHELRHGKMCLKIFVVVIPKEGLAGIGGQGPANPSLGMTPTIKFYSATFTDYVLQSDCHTKRRIAPANPSLGKTLIIKL